MAWAIAGAVGAGALASLASAGKASSAQNAATEKAVKATNDQYATSRADLTPYREAGQAALTRLRSLLGISSGVDETDPRFKSLYDPMVNQFDQAHRARFGMSIYDPRADATSREAQLQQFKDQARQQYLDQYGSQGGTDSSASPLLSKFTPEDLNSDTVYQSGLQFGLDEGTKAIERRAQAGGGYDSGATLKALTRFGNDYGTTKAEGAYGRFRDYQDTTFNKLAGVSGMGSGATTVGVGANTAAGTNLANLYTGQGNANAAATIAGGNAIAGGANNAMGYYYLNKLSGGGQRAVASAPAYDYAG